jgi:pyruvate,water dikinase
VVTAGFQTPLSHVNVLSQQRGTPNMGLRGAQTKLAPLDGKWVRLTVRAFDWDVAEVTADEADAWWQTHKPEPAQIPPPDYSVTDLLDVDDVGPADVAVVGGKAANFGALRDIDDPAVRVRDAIVVPVAYYHDFVVGNGFDARIATMLADDGFRSDGNVRRAMLAQLQADMLAAPVDPTELAAIEARLDADFPATRMKFRSSTNAEDLAHHSGAGLYDSKAGQVGDPSAPVDLALKTVWASVWNFRAFEERDYVSIDPARVAMAVLVTPSYQDEQANGVAITANPFSDDEDGFYINAQAGETSVVQPSPGVVADSMLYYWYHPGQPATYYTHSNQIPAGATVLTRSQLFELGAALDAIRQHFAPIYDLPMDVEWKLEAGQIWIKQARPYPGRGS